MRFVKSEVTDGNKKIEFLVAADPEEFMDAVKAVYLREKKNIQIPGFRKGKVPLAMLENLYGKDVFDQGALEDLVETAFTLGMEEGEFDIIGTPALKDAKVNDDRGAEFVFLVEKYPDVELGQYKNLEIPDFKAEVTEDEVKEALEKVRTQNARTISVDDRPAQKGDTCNIDYEGFLDKEKTQPFDGGKDEGFNLVLGSGQFVPGFEEQLEGMNIGDEKDITVTFPQDYYEHLAGKDVVFHVKLNDISYEELPELDDEFAKDVSEFDTLPEYMESLRNDLLEKAVNVRKSKLRYNALRKAIRNMKAEVPETMVKSHMEAIIRNLASNYGVDDRGMSLETIVSLLGIDENMLKNYIYPSAVEEAQKEMLVKAVIKAEELKAEKEALDAYVDKLSERTQLTAEQVMSIVGLEQLADQYLAEAVIDLISDSAVPVEGLEEEEDADQSEEAPAEAEAAAEEVKEEVKKVTKRQVKKEKEETPEDPEKKPRKPRTTTRKKKTETEAPAEE